MRHVYLLAALGGVAAGIIQVASQLDKIAAFGVLSPLEVSFVIMAILVLGPLGGIFMVWTSSILLRWTGNWIGGKGSREQILAALAWSQIPSIAMAGIISVFLAAYGMVFLLGVQGVPYILRLLMIILFAALLFGVTVWKLIIYFNCLAEAQEFRSAWMAVANNLIAGAIVFAVLIIPLGIMTAVLIPALIHH